MPEDTSTRKHPCQTRFIFLQIYNTKTCHTLQLSEVWLRILGIEFTTCLDLQHLDFVQIQISRVHRSTQNTYIIQSQFRCLVSFFHFNFFSNAKKHVKHVEKLNTDRISFLDAPRRWKVEFSLKKKVVPFDLSQCLLNHRNQEQEHMKDCNIPQINTIEAKAI